MSLELLPEGICYIGADDLDLGLFEGQYPIPQGISYNSYLISDDKVAVIDAIDIRREAQWLESLEKALAGRKPDYLVVQHMEPDHSGAVADFFSRYPDTQLVTTACALKMLRNFFPGLKLNHEPLAVKADDRLPLGSKELHFIMAPMVHWPEVMMCFETSTHTLFSADAFGSFATPSSDNAWNDEARRYYCNIVGKYGRQVQSVLAGLGKYDIRVIAPLHGPVLAGDLCPYLCLYDKWSRYEPENDGALVAYASVYGNTAEVAHRLADELSAAGLDEVVEIDLCRTDVSYAVAEAFRLGRIALCGITYDAGMYPAMQEFLEHLRSKALGHRKYAIVENGSWAPVAGRLMREAVAALPASEVVGDTLTIHSHLHDGDLAALKALAASLSKS